MTAQDLANGKAVGWMQGRMEFGPKHWVVEVY